METALIWLAIGTVLLAGWVAALALVKSFGLVQVRRLNVAQLSQLRRVREESLDPAEIRGLGILIQHCEALHTRWILRDSDLRFQENTNQLVTAIAAAYFPDSTSPLAEARVGRLLKAFLDLNQRLHMLTRLKGVSRITRFRLRHVFFLSRAWQKKQQLQQSAVGKAVTRFRLYHVVKWGYYLLFCLDITFWAVRMARYIAQDIVLKIFLVRWYLIVGELAMDVYRDREKEPEVEPENIMRELESLPEAPAVDAGLPEGVRDIAEASRKKIVFHTTTLEWAKVREIYIQLGQDIAGFHHPDSTQPLHEASLYNLMTGLERFSEKIAALQSYPVVNKLLGFRVSHVFLIQDTAKLVRDQKVLQWLQKYQVRYVLKFSHLLYKAIRNKHPGILFKDFAFFLVKEGGKRWVYFYLHDKIATEVNLIYRESAGETEIR